MSKLAAEVKKLVNSIHDILKVMGAEALESDRSNILTYHDNNIFLQLDESTGRTWVALPVWSEDEQRCVWESVLDVPLHNTAPEKFFTQLIPDGLDIPWTQYLKELRQQYGESDKSWNKLKNSRENDRFIRRWIGRWRLDVLQWLTDMDNLRIANVKTAEVAIQLIDKVMHIPSELRTDLLLAANTQEESAWNL